MGVLGSYVADFRRGFTGVARAEDDVVGWGGGEEDGGVEADAGGGAWGWLGGRRGREGRGRGTGDEDDLLVGGGRHVGWTVVR